MRCVTSEATHHALQPHVRNRDASQIIGVVADLHFNGPADDENAIMFVWRHEPQDGANGFVRHTGDTATALAAAEQAWRRLAPDVFRPTSGVA